MLREHKSPFEQLANIYITADAATQFPVRGVFVPLVKEDVTFPIDFYPTSAKPVE